MNTMITTAVHVDESSVGLPRQCASQLRRADDFIKLAAAASVEALEMCPECQKPGDESGLFVGTAFGPMQTNFDVLGLIVDNDQTSPTLFSHSVFNSAAGYLARLFTLQGSSQTFTDFSWPFFQALSAGSNAISAGRLKQCLVVQVETYSELLADARQRTGQSAKPWHAGAVAWFLEKQDARTGWCIEDISIDSSPAAAHEYLHRKEDLLVGGSIIPCFEPLSAALTITDLLNRKNDQEKNLYCEINAPYGSVGLKLQHS